MSNQQRRASERLQLQRQLEERRRRDASRKRTNTIIGAVGGVVLVAAVVIIVVIASSGGDSKKPAAKNTGTAAPQTTASTQPASTAPAPTEAPVPLPTAPCAAAPKGTTATFAGLTVTGATNLKAAPTVTGKEPATAPKTLQCEDLVVGTGQAAKTTDTGTVEYVGLVYKTGQVFQSSWTSQPATFGFSVGSATNPNGVIAGFSQGIAGAGKVAPMKVGGRRLIIMPAVTAYGANPPQGSGIPADADLVFIVDLQKIGG